MLVFWTILFQQNVFKQKVNLYQNLRSDFLSYQPDHQKSLQLHHLNVAGRNEVGIQSTCIHIVTLVSVRDCNAVIQDYLTALFFVTADLQWKILMDFNNEQAESSSKSAQKLDTSRFELRSSVAEANALLTGRSRLHTGDRSFIQARFRITGSI